MPAKPRSHLTYANVMSTIAVFGTLGGGAYAATTLPSNSVGTKQLKARAVTGAKIASNAVASSKIKNGSIAIGDLSSAAALALKGSKGDPGSPGAKGNTGSPGATGAAGLQGPAGPLVTPEPWHEIGATGEPVFRSGAANAKQLYVCSGPDPQPMECPCTTRSRSTRIRSASSTSRERSSSVGPSSSSSCPPATVRHGRRSSPIDVNANTLARLVIYESFVQLSQPGGYTGTEVYSLDGISFRAGA